MAKFIKTMCGHFHGEIDDKSLKMKVACSFLRNNNNMNVDGRLYKEASFKRVNLPGHKGPLIQPGNCNSCLWLVENTNLVKQISKTCQNIF